MSKTRKVILFVLEGPSDETALGGLFERIFDSSTVKFDIIHGDITTSYRSTEKIREHLRRAIIAHLSQDLGYSWRDLERVVLICDSDGVFIPDDNVCESEDGRLHYGAECIFAGNRELICNRNKKKSDALRKLIGVSELTYNKCKVPLSVYFLSRNLEHALSNKPGECGDFEKEELARKFARKYRNDIGGFVSYLRNDLAVEGDYKQTWDYLAEGTNSLSRCSNLHLVLPETL